MTCQRLRRGPLDAMNLPCRLAGAVVIEMYQQRPGIPASTDGQSPPLCGIAEQSQRTLRVYDTSILPQSHFTVEAALSAYRVNRVDMLTLLDSQMASFGFEVSRAQTLASYHKALAEIDLLTGKGSGQ